MMIAAEHAPETGAFVRLGFLDALRGFAALYVLMFHIAWLPEQRPEVPAWMADYVFNGGTGVSLFFVVSAFALSYSLDARRDEAHPERHFYIRRFFRIAPLFYVMMVVYSIRDAWQTGTYHSVGEILVNASMLFNLFPSHIAGYVWASWTIGVEVVFYLIFPLVFRFIRTPASVLMLFLASVAVSRGWGFFLEHHGVASGYVRADQIQSVAQLGFLNQLPVFVCGVLAYRLYVDYFIRLAPKRRHQLGFAFLLAFVVLYSALLAERLDEVLWDDQVWLGVIYACLMLGLGLRPLALLVNRFTQWLGKISYSLYLLHPLLVLSLAPGYHWLYRHAPTTTLAFLAAFAVTAALLAGVSWISYRLVERVGIGWGEGIIGRGVRSSLEPNAVSRHQPPCPERRDFSRRD